MLKISITETPSERRLVVEGKLIEPWIDELKRSWREAAEHTDGRKLVIDLNSATVISHEGQTVLFEMMKEGAKFSCGGVLTRHVMQSLASKCQEFVRKAAGRHSGD
jgi:hypothetical protein